MQFARLESLLKQAARSPGRQSWKVDGQDQVRAATGTYTLTPLSFACYHCCYAYHPIPQHILPISHSLTTILFAYQPSPQQVT